MAIWNRLYSTTTTEKFKIVKYNKKEPKKEAFTQNS